MPKQPSKRKSNSISPLVDAWIKCVTQPWFQDSALSRVPDDYEIDASPFHNSGGAVVNSSAGGTCSISFFNHPLLTCTDNTRLAGGSTSFSGGMGMYQPSAGVNPWVYSITSFSALSGNMSMYRQVGFGLRIRQSQQPNNAQGRCTIVLTPTPDTPIPYNAIVNNAPTAGGAVAFQAIAGIPLSSVSSNAIENYPQAFEFSLADLITNDVVVFSKPSSPKFLDVHCAAAANAWSASVNIGDDQAYATSTGVQQATSNWGDLVRLAGWSGIHLYFDNCAVSGAVCEIEYFLHVEGVPIISNAYGLIPESINAILRADRGHFQNGLDVIARTTPVKMIPRTTGAVGMAGYIVKRQGRR